MFSGVSVACCYQCEFMSASRRLGENCCAPCNIPGAPMALRMKLRLLLGIKVSNRRLKPDESRE